MPAANLAVGAAPQQPAPAPIFRLDGTMSPQTVIRFQGVVGNAAYNRARTRPGAPVQRFLGFGKSAKKKGPTDVELKQMAAKGGSATPTTGADVNDVGENKNVEHAQEALGYGADLTGVPGDTLSNFGGETDRMHGDSITFTGDTGQAGLSSAGAGVGGLGSGLTAVGGGVGVYLAVQKLRNMANGTDPGNNWDKASTLTALIGSAGTGLAGGAQTVSNLTAAGGNAALAAGKDAGEGVANAASGATESLGALGAMVEVAVSSVQAGIQLAQLVKGKKWNAQLASGAAVDVLKAFKGISMMAKSAVGAANSFMSLAGEAIAVLPIIGAAINIVAQLIDILMQLIEVAMRVYKLVKAAVQASKLRTMAAGTGLAADAKKFATGMAENAKKRWQRQIAPLIANAITIFADFISIGASVLNIVGAATAAAYGAGVAIMAGGYAATALAGGLKVGAALIKPGQSLVRWGKQKIRDKGVTNPKVKKAGEFMRIDMTKTKAYKNDLVAGQISFLMGHLKSLDPLPSESDPKYTETKAKYEQAHLLVKATGVSVKDLSDAATTKDVVKLLAAAIRERE